MVIRVSESLVLAAFDFAPGVVVQYVQNSISLRVAWEMDAVRIGDNEVARMGQGQTVQSQHAPMFFAGSYHVDKSMH